MNKGQLYYLVGCLEPDGESGNSVVVIDNDNDLIDYADNSIQQVKEIKSVKKATKLLLENDFCIVEVYKTTIRLYIPREDKGYKIIEYYKDNGLVESTIVDIFNNWHKYNIMNIISKFLYNNNEYI